MPGPHGTAPSAAPHNTPEPPEVREDGDVAVLAAPYGPSRAVRLHRVSGQREHRTTGLLSKRKVRLAC